MKTINISELNKREVLWEQSNNNINNLISETSVWINNILSWKWLSEQEIILAKTINQQKVLNILNNQFWDWLNTPNWEQIAA